MEQPFLFERIQCPTKLEGLYSLRYQVYCEERGFIPKETCPDQLESDHYDQRSLHFGAYMSDNGEVAGTVRFVLADQLNELPMFGRCIVDPDLLPPDVNAGNSAEISRLAVSKQALRRSSLARHLARKNLGQPLRSPRRQATLPEPILGLYTALYQHTKRAGLKYWFAAMEPSLAKLVSRSQFHFDPIGPEVDYYGPVRPYLASVDFVDQALLQNAPELLARLTEGLEPHFTANLFRNQ